MAAFILVHLGARPVGRILNDCLKQLYDTHCDHELSVYLYISDKASLCDVEPCLLERAIIVGNEAVTPEHTRFLETTALDYNSWPGNGYWLYCSERFMAIHDVMAAYDLKNAFHIETDILVYHPAQEVLPVLQKNNVEIGLTLLNENKVIPGVIYLRDQNASKAIADHFINMAPSGKNDMEVLAAMINSDEYRSRIYPLPVTPAGHELKVDRPDLFARDQCDFGVVFDAAAIGQWLGGVDPIIPCGVAYTPFMNHEASYRFDTASITFDELKRPYVNGTPVFNMHVHSKQLGRWRSLANTKTHTREGQ